MSHKHAYLIMAHHELYVLKQLLSAQKDKQIIDALINHIRHENSI